MSSSGDHERRPHARVGRARRVLVLVDVLGLGGAESLAVELAAGVDPRRYRTFVVATKRGGPLEDSLRAAGVPYVVLGRRCRSSGRAAFRLLRLARASDLIHSHLFGNNVWGALAARVAGVPLLAHEHNRVGRHSRLEPLLDRLLIGPTAYRVLCVSEAVGEALVTAGFPPRKIEVIPNGIRLEDTVPRDLARRELGLPDDARVIGIVASLRPEKAHDLLLEAFADLIRDGRPQLVLCVVGDGPERHRLQGLARRLGIAEAVLWAGERPGARRLMSAFELSVLCSRSEGLPLAALEAMAAGVPVVATRVGSIPDLLADGGGLVVEQGDRHGLADALATLLDDPALAHTVGATGRARVVARHDLRTTIARIESLYDEALAPEGRLREERSSAGGSPSGGRRHRPPAARSQRVHEAGHH